MNKKRLFIFTTTRADYSLLRLIIKKLEKSSEFDPVVVVGGTHLLKNHGYTLNEILVDNIKNIVKLPFFGVKNDALSSTLAIGEGLVKLSRILSRYKPDYFMLLGDRYELFIPAVAALISNIPIIHMHGGELSEGAIDQQVRHSLTKLAHIHMPSTRKYAENISRMGEEDWRIHVVGAPGLENIKECKFYTKNEIYRLCGVTFDLPSVLCTYHAVTLEQNNEQQIRNILNALSKLDIQVIFTGSNADVGSEAITKLIKSYVNKNNKAYFFNSLGSRLYLSMLKYVKAVVGNSSSGIIEVPSFKIPTVDVGSRQKGRLSPPSVIHTGYSERDIENGLEKALHDKAFRVSINSMKNPYGDGNASIYILDALSQINKIPRNILLTKKLIFGVNKNEWYTYYKG